MAAYFYEIQPSDQYKMVADLSIEFIMSRLWNGTIVLDTFDPRTCTTTTNTTIITLNSAYFIEGLSVWANVTGNSTLTSM
jgi:hypothetical protein